ncbi:MAG: hypothetical protein K9J16_07325 [Melioribacteraceae bacterium]|nr:hypothetical protein [Melioribacteraceae bacterium]MCF8354924.1 hypothetical protein [Melioribacteraceae bacterium]MCF8392387.1 hypothetical protein [Melioribacteraceae bacterium]MCF8417908.1 hypothetical protein [Melioribacteraceae bacterium]
MKNGKIIQLKEKIDMLHKINTAGSERSIKIENNVVEKLVQINLPENWWNSVSSYDVTTQNKQLKIYPIRKRYELSNVTKPRHWDIENGDYMAKVDDTGFERNLDTRRKNDGLFFFAALILAGLLIVAVSDLIASLI